MDIIRSKLDRVTLTPAGVYENCFKLRSSIILFKF